MTVAEIVMEDQELDDHFQRLGEMLSARGLKQEETEEVEVNKLDWWVSEYPTLKSAEAELLNRNQKIKSINKTDYEEYCDYMSEVASLDQEIMMLEMTVDSLYKDWMPDGADHSEFKTGTIFRSGSGRWLCTDIGSRVIIAIRYTPSMPDEMDGPPYMCVERVFDESDIKSLTILSK